MTDPQKQWSKEHSPEPWIWKNSPGVGIQIIAPVPFKANCVEFTLKDAPQPVFGIPDAKYVVAHETWIQFAPEQWQALQEANAARIVACINFLEGVPTEKLTGKLKDKIDL